MSEVIMVLDRSKGGMQFQGARSADLYGRATKEPDWRPLHPDQSSDIIVNRHTGQRMKMDPIRKWVNIP
jgi:hypothetical protein